MRVNLHNPFIWDGEQKFVEKRCWSLFHIQAWHKGISKDKKYLQNIR